MEWTPEEQAWLENNRSVLGSNKLSSIANRLRELENYDSRLKMAYVLSAMYDVPISILHHGYIKSVKALFDTTEVSLGNISKEEIDPLRLFEHYKKYYKFPENWRMEDLKWDDEVFNGKFWHIVKG